MTSAFLERMYDPWMDDASFYGLVRACETDDVDRARERGRTFMSCRECCAEGLFVKPMQERARANNAVSPEEVLLSEEVKKLMDWSGMTPPILTISAMESNHAAFVNLLTSKGFARTGPRAVLLDTLMTRYRNRVDARLLLEIERLLSKASLGVSDKKKKRQNQYGAPRNMIGQIHAEVKRTKKQLTCQRQLPEATRPQKLGTRLFFEQVCLRAAKRNDPGKWTWEKMVAFRQRTANKWGTLTQRGKAHWDQQRRAVVGTRASKKRPQIKGLKSNREEKPVLTSPCGMGSDTRPIADKVLDRHFFCLFSRDATHLGNTLT